MTPTLASAKPASRISVYLMVLLGQHLVILLFKTFLKDRQSALDPFLGDQLIERHRPGPDVHRLFPLYFHKGKQILRHPGPVTVNLLQFFFG